jgi:hypothetical protein
MFLKLVGNIQLRVGVQVTATTEKKLSFEPIQLKKNLASERISALKDDSWTSS